MMDEAITCLTHGRVGTFRLHWQYSSARKDGQADGVIATTPNQLADQQSAHLKDKPHTTLLANLSRWVPAGPIGTAAVAEMAAGLLLRLVAHSRFAGALAQRNAPLPPAAARLQAPLESLLPVVEDDCCAQRVRAAQKVSWVCFSAAARLQARDALLPVMEDSCWSQQAQAVP